MPHHKWLYGFVQRILFNREALVSLSEQPRKLVLQNAVAFAGVGFEPVSVKNCQPAAGVADSPVVLEGAGCDCHTSTPHAQHVG